MKTKNLELWLDESGDFNNQSNLRRSPSLVGGILIEKKMLNERDIIKILEADYVHSNEIKGSEFGEYAVRVISQISENGGCPIIFQNEERLEIIDGSTTYLNVLSEGIIQLIQLLNAEYNKVSLDIIIAVRLEVEEQANAPGKIIKEKEYIKRIEEKIILGLARKTIYNSNFDWNVQLLSARKDPRLMVADVVCNSWLTKESSKFISNREKLLDLYQEKYYFSVLSNMFDVNIKQLLSENNLTEAIYSLYISDSGSNRSDILKIILKRMKILDDKGRSVQLENLTAKIGIIIKIQKDYSTSKILLNRIANELFPLMDEYDIDEDVFRLNIYLYLLTIYTHEGDIQNSDRLIKVCDTTFIRFAGRWESLDYFFILKLRKIIHLINCFDFKNAEIELTSIISATKDMKDVFSIIDGLDELYGNIKSDILGKALGTRILTRCHLIRGNQDLYSCSIEDSEIAMEEFLLNSDIKRQWQYRSQIECEYGNYSGALGWLLGKNKFFIEDLDIIDNFFNNILEIRSSSRAYDLMHYVRIMTESFIGGEENFSEMMYDKFMKNSDLIIKMIEDENGNHPFEIIHWKLGTYHGFKGNTNASVKYYDNAIKICFLKKERWTMMGIGLGILAEKASMLYRQPNKYHKDANIVLKEFVNKYNDFIELDLPEPMMNYFLKWRENVNQLTSCDNSELKDELLWKISRNITY